MQLIAKASARRAPAPCRRRSHRRAGPRPPRLHSMCVYVYISCVCMCI